MEPNVLVCSPILRTHWLELARNNGISVTGNGENAVIADEERSFTLRFREETNGNFRLNIQKIDDESLRTRIELMTFASGGKCPVSLTPFRYDPTFRCPSGFCDEWFTTIPSAQVQIKHRWSDQESVRVADGSLCTRDLEADFITGVAYDEEAAAFREFISFAPKRPMLLARRFENSLEKQMEIVRNLGGVQVMVK